MNIPERCSGVLLHLSALPGPHGSGDLGPAAHGFVQTRAGAGQALWQLLPLNPIGPGNSPYQSVSAFAGSPLLVALEPLVKQGWMAAPVVPDFEPGRVNFDRVVPWRMAQLRAAHAGFAEQATPAQRMALAGWSAEQAGWLDDYTLFMALEVAHGGRPWWTWAEGLRWRDAAALSAARSEQAAEIHFWQFVQWCFDTQCRALKAHANRHGVALVGDLPIFIAHHSADCWARPDLYELDAAGQPTVVAGCPPDPLGPEGQRWGNPLYRWERMAAEGYSWWTARVRRALTQADALRIDHFRGFAGYWAIPASTPHARDGAWRVGPGKPLFDAIQAALGRLPILAEDLGTITPDVIALRDECGFPGMKILQHAFGGDGEHEFLPHQYPRACVVYSGTHDNDTARGWWDAASAAERRLAAAYLGLGGDSAEPNTDLSAEDRADALAPALLRAAATSVAAMAIFPLQDLLGLPTAARFNLPGSVGPHNWGWRHQPAAGDAAAWRRLAQLSAASGRAPNAPNAPLQLAP